MTYDSALITGGAGFIGSHLAESLLARGARVTVVDDMSTGSWSNISHLGDRDNLRVLIAPASDYPLMEAEVPRHDVVFHLASAVGVKLIIEQPVATIERIVNTTEVVLALCRRYRVPAVIASSSEVYGKSTTLPFKEDADTVMGPSSTRRWGYAAAKALDEFLALAHFHETGLPVSIVRLFNTAGQRQSASYGMVLPRFIRQALRGEPITVFGDGTQSRCFCAVQDVVAALERIPEIPDAFGKVINLGSQEETTIQNLAELVRSSCDSKSPIQNVSYMDAYGEGFDDMKRRVPDITRAARILDWAPSRSLREIIEDIKKYELELLET